jgi:hypothetical protein
MQSWIKCYIYIKVTNILYKLLDGLVTSKFTFVWGEQPLQEITIFQKVQLKCPHWPKGCSLWLKAWGHERHMVLLGSFFY